MFFDKLNSISSNGNISVEPDMRYVGEAGAIQLLIDNEKNDYALFESLVMIDFQEVAVQHGMLNESAMEAINEASSDGLLSRIIAWIRKIWGKIQGLFMSFFKTLEARVTLDNKKLAKKFSDIKSQDFSDLTVKYCEQKKDFDQVFSKNLQTTKFDSDAVGAKVREYLEKAIAKKAIDENGLEQLKDKLTGEKGKQEKYDNFLAFKIDVEDDIKKQIHEEMWENEEEHEKPPITEMLDWLSGADKPLKDLKAAKKANDAKYKSAIDELQKIANKISQEKDYVGSSNHKDIATAGGKTFKSSEFTSNANKGTNKPGDYKYGVFPRVLSAYQTNLNIESQAYSTCIGAYISEYKFAIKQARKVVIKAIGYATKKKYVKENMDIEDLIDYETDALFDDAL